MAELTFFKWTRISLIDSNLHYAVIEDSFIRVLSAPENVLGGDEENVLGGDEDLD